MGAYLMKGENDDLYFRISTDAIKSSKACTEYHKIIVI